MGIEVLFILMLVGAPLAVSIVALVVALRKNAGANLPVLEQVLQRHERVLNELEHRIQTLRDEMRVLRAQAPPEASPAPHPVPGPAMEPAARLETKPDTIPMAAPTPPPAAPEPARAAPGGIPPLPAEPAETVASKVARAPSAVPPRPLPPPEKPGMPEAPGIEPVGPPAIQRPPAGTIAAPPRQAQPTAPAGSVTDPGRPAGAQPPRRPAMPPPPPSPPVRPPSQPPASFDWEGLVGVKLFSWIAGVALLLAAVFFLRYSIDRGWLMPPVRMVIGILVGVGLLILCEIKAARNYSITANAMDGSAVAILFATFFSAHALWNLIGGGLTFLMLALVTAVAVLLSIRRDSLFIALLGLLGGFATPVLLSTGENRPLSLFGYLLILNAGLALVASRKKWPLLTALSLILTTLYQWGWVMKFLTAGQLSLAAGIFLVFPILTFAVLALGYQSEERKGWNEIYGRTAELSALLPILFALYVASASAYGARTGVLFGFLFLLDAGLFAIAAARRREILHLAGAAATLVVFAAWFMNSYSSAAWPVVLALISLFTLFYLTAPWMAQRCHRPFQSWGRMAIFAAPLLLSAFAVLAGIEPRCAAPAALFSVLFLLLAATAYRAVVAGEGSIYFLAVFFSLAAEAVWSATYLTPERLLQGLALYGIFALFYIGVPAAARRRGKPLQPEIAGPVLMLAALALLLFLAVPASGGVSLWGLALLLLLINAGLLIEGTAAKFAAITIPGVILSWIILAVFWANAPLKDILIPAMVVIAGYAVLALAGILWQHRRTEGRDDALPWRSVFLGLAGHLFLFEVAVQSSLSIPPWPLLGVLFVLDLAAGAAALYFHRHQLHMAALLSSGVILVAWIATADFAPWPAVGVWAAAVLAAIGLVWMYLARRAGIATDPFAGAAEVGIFTAQGVTIVAGILPGAPGIGLLVTIHLAFLAALLALAWLRDRHHLAVLAVIPTALGVSLWMGEHAGSGFWTEQMIFAVPIYVAFVAYPMLLGGRAGRAIAPYLAAVLASATFFFQARHTMIVLGLGGFIGILPVLQALLMALLLMRLLQLEPPGSRSLGRLALVAGTALAFVTVSIPLQLEKESLTIGWALEGAALAWLYCRIRHRGLLYTTAGLLATVFVRLAMNPWVLDYWPRSDVPVFNWYMYTYLIAAVAMFLAAGMLKSTDDRLGEGLPQLSHVLPGAGVILLFALLNIEIADYFSTGTRILFNFTATLAQDMTYTLGWALFGVALLAVGIAARNPPARITALALLVVTILKCFLHDLGRLGGMYRVVSFVGLALCLALVALALQKYVLAARKEVQ